MSLTYSKNRNGPNIDPWGTLQVRFPRSENFFININFKDSSWWIRFRPWNYFFRKSNASHFLRSISWSIVSKAFCKSINIKPVYFPDSKPLFILSVNNVKQEFVENDFRNPDWYLHKILFLFQKISVWLWMIFSMTFETSCKSETGW